MSLSWTCCFFTGQPSALLASIVRRSVLHVGRKSVNSAPQFSCPLGGATQELLSFPAGTIRLISSGADILASFGPEKALSFEGNDVEFAMEKFAIADAVAFDVDSTVIQEEGIDVLAESLGKEDEVSAWTAKAMDGGVKFEEALSARLDIIKPSRDDIRRCMKETPLKLTPGVEQLTSELSLRGIDVYLVSGGFRIMIEPLAETLKIAKSRIYANTLFFDDDNGDYVGFDLEEPTSADMGKQKALQRIKEEGKYETMIMIGDGVTDAQAVPPADAFIGFGGVIIREAVKKKASWYCTDFGDLIAIVNKFGGSSR